MPTPAEVVALLGAASVQEARAPRVLGPEASAATLLPLLPLLPLLAAAAMLCCSSAVRGGCPWSAGCPWAVGVAGIGATSALCVIAKGIAKGSQRHLGALPAHLLQALLLQALLLQAAQAHLQQAHLQQAHLQLSHPRGTSLPQLLHHQAALSVRLIHARLCQRVRRVLLQEAPPRAAQFDG